MTHDRKGFGSISVLHDPPRASAAKINRDAAIALATLALMLILVVLGLSL